MLFFNNSSDGNSGRRHAVIATIISTNPKSMLISQLSETQSYYVFNNKSTDNSSRISMTVFGSSGANLKIDTISGDKGDNYPYVPAADKSYYLRNNGELFYYRTGTSYWCKVYTGIYYLIYTDNTSNILYYVYYTIYMKPTFVTITNNNIYDGQYHGYIIDSLSVVDLKNIINSINIVNGNLEINDINNTNSVNIGDSLLVKNTGTIYTLYMIGNSLSFNSSTENTIFFSVIDNVVYKLYNGVVSYVGTFDSSINNINGSIGNVDPNN